MSEKIGSLSVLSRSGMGAASESLRGPKGKDGGQGKQGPIGGRGPPGKCCEYDHIVYRVIRSGGTEYIENNDKAIIIASAKETVNLVKPKILIVTTPESNDSYMHVQTVDILVGKSSVSHYLDFEDEIHKLQSNKKYTAFCLEGKWTLCKT